MSITQDDFKKIWASTSSVPEYTFSDSDYQDGWEFVGNLPPTRAMWDTLQRRNDQKMKYLQDNGSMCFDSVAEMVATDIDEGQMVITKGYYSVNDGGSALYTVRDKDVADVDDGGSIIILDNGNIAELITNGTVNVKQFGAYGDGTHDDTQAIQNAINYALVNNESVLLTSMCLITSSLVINRQVDTIATTDYFYIKSYDGGGFKTTENIPLFTTTLAYTTNPVSQMIAFVGLRFNGNDDDSCVLDGNKFLRVLFSECNFTHIKGIKAQQYVQTITYENCCVRHLTGNFIDVSSVTYGVKFTDCIFEAISGTALALGTTRGSSVINCTLEGCTVSAITYGSAYGFCVTGCYFEENGLDIDGSTGTEVRGVALIGNQFIHSGDEYTVKWAANIRDCVSLGNSHSKNMHSVTKNSDLLVKDFASQNLWNNEPTPRLNTVLAFNDKDTRSNNGGATIKGDFTAGFGDQLQFGHTDASGTFTPYINCSNPYGLIMLYKRVNFDAENPTVTATAGTASLPSNPEGFLTVFIRGQLRKIPFYNE